MQEHIRNWLDFLKFQRRLTHSTQIRYLDGVRDFMNFLLLHLGEFPTLQHLEKLEVKDFRAWLISRKDYVNVSNACALSSVKSFWMYLQKHDLLQSEVATLVRPPKVKKTLPRPLTHSQTDVLMDFIEDSHEILWLGLRNKALVTLLYATGMRISEALSLKQKDHRVDVLNIIGKGNKERQIPLLPEARTAIMKYLSHCPYLGDDFPLFFTKTGKPMRSSEANKMIREFRRLHNLPESLTPHALRHTCATHLMKESKDIRGIQTLLGHASLSSTQIYTDLDMESLLDTYAATHPRSNK